MVKKNKAGAKGQFTTNTMREIWPRSKAREGVACSRHVSLIAVCVRHLSYMSLGDHRCQIFSWSLY